MSIISNAAKSHFENIIKNVAETFERDIVVYLEADKAVISTDVNFSKFSPRRDEVENVPVYYTIPARVQFQDRQSKEFVDVLQGGSKDESQFKIDGYFGQVRIKVNESGHNIIKTAKQIELDGNQYSVKTTAKGHGLFSSQYYTYYLEILQ